MSRISFNQIKTTTYFIRQFSLNMTITRFDELYQFEMSVLCTTPNIIYDGTQKRFAWKQQELVLTEKMN